MDLKDKLSVLAGWLKNPKPEEWDSLIINKREPHTHRVFRSLPDGTRVCLHRFSHCDEDDAFAHPHSWPAEFFILHGYYTQYLYQAQDLESIPLLNSPNSVHLHCPGSYYKIDNPLTWHKIVPQSDYVYTIMLSGQPWEQVSSHVKSTKGKDLDKMRFADIQSHLDMFALLYSVHKAQLKTIADYVKTQ